MDILITSRSRIVIDNAFSKVCECDLASLLGTKPQTRPKITIIAKSLQKKKGVGVKSRRDLVFETGLNTHKSCKLSIPKFEAIVLVKNGRTALPPAPQAAIQTTASQDDEEEHARRDLWRKETLDPKERQL